MNRAICVAIALAVGMTVFTSNALQNGGSQAGQPFWNDLKAGPHAVGFRVLYYRDHRHKWNKEPVGTVADPGRPIRVSLWYPAVPATSVEPMKYGDYLRHDGPDEFRQINNELDKNDAESWLSDLSELSPPGQPMFEKLLSTPVAAYANAPAAPGR